MGSAAWTTCLACGVLLALGCGESTGSGGNAGGSASQAGSATGGSATSGGQADSATAGATAAGATNGGAAEGGEPSGGASTAGSATGSAAAGSAGSDPTGGATGFVDCDPRKVLCRVLAPECPQGEVPSVEGSCYGDCVKIDRCSCSSADECPEPEQYTCLKGPMHCSYYLR